MKKILSYVSVTTLIIMFVWISQTEDAMRVCTASFTWADYISSFFTVIWMIATMLVILVTIFED